MNTALGAAMQARGISPRDNALALAVAKFQNAGGEYGVARAILDAAFKMDEATRSLTHRVQSYRAKSSPESTRLGQEKSGTAPSQSLPKRVAPPKTVEAYVQAAKHVQKMVAMTVLDSFKVRDGRAIGDITFGELEGLRSENAREASIIRQIQRHAANVTADAKVRDIIKASDLERMIQRGAEVADAA